MLNVTFPYEKEFRRFAYPGVSRRGQCYLKVRVNQEGRAVFLCAQLLNYTGTSVTNAVEDILVGVVGELANEGVFKNLSRRNWFKKSPQLELEVARTCRWIEHYPPGAGLAPNGSYALVSFDSNLSPAWNYMDLARAATICEVDQKFLRVAPDELHHGS